MYERRALLKSIVVSGGKNNNAQVGAKKSKALAGIIFNILLLTLFPYKGMS